MINDGLKSARLGQNGLLNDYSNLCERKIMIAIFEAGPLLYDLHFNEVGGSRNADWNPGNDDDLSLLLRPSPIPLGILFDLSNISSVSFQSETRTG